ncbi:hypothetical protein KCP73_01295 [Salmonella enterica subsp. enterica]|nr:hypothetical protein KCP73_01295 [Salmonella enterica subsp. enterica]
MTPAANAPSGNSSPYRSVARGRSLVTGALVVARILWRKAVRPQPGRAALKKLKAAQEQAQVRQKPKKPWCYRPVVKTRAAPATPG